MQHRVVTLTATLMLVIGVGTVVKCRSGRTPGPLADPPTVALEVQIKSIEVRPTGDFAQLILKAVFHQNGQTPLRLEPPLVSLITASQAPAARYLGPMLPEPVLSGPGPAEVTLHYWLPVSDLKAPLNLVVSGRSHPVELPGS